MRAAACVLALLALLVAGCTSTATIAPAVGSLVCGEPGASYAPGWAQCKTAEQLRCHRARTICNDVAGADGCETGYSNLAAPPSSTGAGCAEVLRYPPQEAR